MRRRDPLDELEAARTAMEIFDLAAEMMSRVRGSASVQRAARQIGLRCVAERNRLLVPLNRARASLSAGGSDA